MVEASKVERPIKETTEKNVKATQAGMEERKRSWPVSINEQSITGSGKGRSKSDYNIFSNRLEGEEE